MNIVPDVVDAQLRLQFLGRDVTLPSVMASDPAHDPNALPVEALKKPLMFSAFTTKKKLGREMAEGVWGP